MAFFLVTGTPRSGTALVAGILHRSGVHMGDEFALASPMHPTGCWEDVAVTGFTGSVMEEINASEVPHEEQMAMAFPRLKALLAERAEANAGRDWGVKDPRAVPLWDAYERALEGVADPRLVLCHRNSVCAALSLLKWSLVDDDFFKCMRTVAWYEYAMAYKVARRAWELDWPVCHIAFEYWWRRGEEQLAGLAKFVGRELDFSIFDGRLWRS